jgi:hypothetical protein
MPKTLQQELDEYRRLLGIFRKLFTEDGTIKPDERSHLDVLEGKIKKIVSAAGGSDAGSGNAKAFAGPNPLTGDTRGVIDGQSAPLAGPNPNMTNFTGGVTTAAPSPKPNLTAGEMVARDKKAAAVKRAQAFGLMDGKTGKKEHIEGLQRWTEVTELEGPARALFLAELINAYNKAFESVVGKLVTLSGTGDLSAREMVARDKKTAALKKARELGLKDGKTGKKTHFDEIQKWPEVTELPDGANVALLGELVVEYTKAFESVAPKCAPLPGTPIATTPSVKREPLERRAPNPGWGGSTGDDSSIRFDVRAHLFVQGMVRDQTALSPSGSLAIDAGQSGRLKILVQIEGDQDNASVPVVGGNDSFTQEAEGTWDISADEKGALKIKWIDFHLEGPSTIDTDYSVQPIIPAEDEAKGIIRFNVVVVGKTQSKASGWNVGRSGEKWGGGYERNTTNQTGPGLVQEMFSVQIKVVNIPKPPAPKEPTGTVEIGNQVLVEREFVIGPFVVKNGIDLDMNSSFNPKGAEHLKATSVQKAVYDLFYSLPEETRDILASGELAGSDFVSQDQDGTKSGHGRLIKVEGYASNTDTDKRNFDLSYDRADTVFKAFKGLGVPAKVFEPPHPHGEWQTRDKDKGIEPTDVKKLEKESADWRKVTIKLRYVESHKVNK